MTKAEKRALLERAADLFLASGGKVNVIPQGVTTITDDAAYWAGFAKDSNGESKYGYEREQERALKLAGIIDEEDRLTRYYGDTAHDDYSEDSFP